ncbi:MAG TPA: ABC transporter substrate-binding protein [Solirubrobacteraceae bacterium]|nr:ABC transporter substrate-binding protein [Solirubrobacteraceae bacterium]
MRRMIGCAMAVGALALAAAGCGSSSSTSSGLAPGAPLKIGYLASLTGFCSTFSQEYVKGAELAVKQINEQGGVLGHKLQLEVRDDKATANTGVSQARDLVLSGHVKYLAGTCSSAVGKSVEQLVANPSHVLYVAGVADPTIFEGGSNSYIFGTIPTAGIEGRNAAAYIHAHPQWKRVAVVSEDYSYGYQVTAAFKKAMEGSGQTIISQDYVTSGGTDFTPIINKIIAEHPDAVYSTVITEDTVTLVKQGLPLGLFEKTHFFGVMDYGTIDAMPKPPVGVEGYTYYPSAAIYHTPFAKDLESLGTAVANGGAAGDAFNQVQIIAQGIDRAKSTDPTKVRDVLDEAEVQTVQGNVRFHKCNHLMTLPIAMGTVVGPSKAQPFAHFEPLTLVDSDPYFEC